MTQIPSATKNTTNASSAPTPARKTRRGDSSTRTTVRSARRRGVARTVTNVIVSLLMLVWFTPILAMLLSSFRTQEDSALNGWWTVFGSPAFTIDNYIQSFQTVGIGGSMLTSIAIAIPTTILTTFLSAIGAFALVRMRFRGRAALTFLLIAMLVVPPQVTLVPLLRVFNLIHITGTIPAIWIFQVGFTVPFGIFLIRGFIASMPEELFESAALDGASALRTFRSLVLPLAAPVLAALSILQFLWAWNDLLIPLIFLGGTELPSPLTMQVSGLAQSYNQGQALLMSSAFISVIIPVVVLLTLQRYFVRGVLGGAVKG